MAREKENWTVTLGLQKETDGKWSRYRFPLRACRTYFVTDLTPAITCLATAVVVYFCAHLIQYRDPVRPWLDPVWLARYAITGTANNFMDLIDIFNAINNLHPVTAVGYGTFRRIGFPD